jgi:hypothetical protein
LFVRLIVTAISYYGLRKSKQKAHVLSLCLKPQTQVTFHEFQTLNLVFARFCQLVQMVLEMRVLENAIIDPHLIGIVILLVIFSKSVNFLRMFYKTEHLCVVDIRRSYLTNFLFLLISRYNPNVFRLLRNLSLQLNASECTNTHVIQGPYLCQFPLISVRRLKRYSSNLIKSLKRTKIKIAPQNLTQVYRTKFHPNRSCVNVTFGLT